MNAWPSEGVLESMDGLIQQEKRTTEEFLWEVPMGQVLKCKGLRIFSILILLVRNHLMHPPQTTRELLHAQEEDQTADLVND